MSIPPPGRGGIISSWWGRKSSGEEGKEKGKGKGKGKGRVKVREKRREKESEGKREGKKGRQEETGRKEKERVKGGKA